MKESVAQMTRVLRTFAFLTAVCAVVLSASWTVLATDSAAAEDAPPWRHGIAMHGSLKYPADFTHFDYVNPYAPKGGRLKQATVSDGYDSFNAILPRGSLASGTEMIYDTLMVSSLDEPFSQYGLLAEAIQVPEDRSWVAFRLNEEARWHDGEPVDADDVIWSFNMARELHPFYAAYFGNVSEVLRIDDRTIRFNFRPGENDELPLILGQLTVLPKHYWEDRDITKTTLDPPLGSGPYRIVDFEANRFVVYERVEDYWGADLPVNRGHYNFDRMRFDYYGEGTIALEAFKAGAFDLRVENIAKNWAVGYNVPAVENGMIQRREFEIKTPSGMQGFIFNLRRDKFKDPRVREALAAVFDFEWSNETFFFNSYRRARSYFNNSELEAKGIPEGRELEILEEFRGQVPERVFTTEYNPPVAGTPRKLRRNLLDAAALLEEAGWVVNPDTLMLENAETGRPFRIEILLAAASFKRIVLPVAKNLERLGIETDVRLVDSSQFVQRVRTDRDYDTFVTGFGQSLSPGNEQRTYWSSEAADNPNSRNYTGIKDPVVDRLVEMVIEAPSRKELVYRTRALDRVLQWHHLVIPQYYGPVNRVAFWNKFGLPKEVPLRGVNFDTWWFDPTKPAADDRNGKTARHSAE